MIIEECAFLNKEKQTCNLLPECYNLGLDYRFTPCEHIAILQCPYKKFKRDLITKQQLNDEVRRLTK